MTKKRILMLAICLLGMVMLLTQENKVQTKETQKGIASRIIRFHIIADNDSEEAQALKIRMKDQVLCYIKTFLSDSENKEETEAVLKEHLGDIQSFVSQAIQKEGYSYPVTAELTTCYFPIKEYGSVTFPEGTYEALRIKIGKAEGKNWWCVMYPNLCFVDGTYAVVSEETKKELKMILTKDQYKELLEGGKTKVKFRFLTFLNEKK